MTVFTIYVQKNPNLILATTEYGGHLGWLEGWTPKKDSWSDHVCVEFVSSVMEHCKASNADLF